MLRYCLILGVVLLAGCVAQPGSSIGGPDVQDVPGASETGTPGTETPGANDTGTASMLNATGVIVFDGCRGAIPAMRWSRAVLPWPAPEGMENDYPIPETRMFAFTCDSMDALGLQTFTNASIAILAHSNTSRAHDLQDDSYDAALVGLQYYLEPAEARQLLAEHGVMDALPGTVTVDPDLEAPQIDVRAESGGSVEVSLNRQQAEEATDLSLPPRTWLVWPASSMAVPMTVGYEGLGDGYSLIGTWTSRGDVAYADWPVMADHATPVDGTYMHDVTLTLKVVE